MVSETTAFLVPASTMPVPPQIRCQLGNDDEMAETYVDQAVTAGADVGLARLVGLNRVYDMIVEVPEETSRVVVAGIARGGHERKGRGERRESKYLHSVVICMYAGSP